jgi:hypothetical protein
MALPSLDDQIANLLVTQSVAHMQQQVGQVAETQAALSQLWASVLDPSDLVGSFQRFTVGAATLITAARSRGQITAQQFYQEQRALAGITDTAPNVPPVPLSIEADLTSLYVTGLVTIQKQLSNGANSAAALDAAEAAVLRSAQRRILEAPRQRIIDLSQADPNASGWARVGDGDPCYFCAMLIGRGPVYHSQASASFHAHDGCGCSARIVFKNDPSKGWTDDAHALHRAWYGAEDGAPIDYHNGTTLNEWRKTYNDMRADPHSPISVALAGPRRAYGLAA